MSRKRTLKELEDEDNQKILQPPSKKIKLSDNANNNNNNNNNNNDNNSNILENSIEILKNDTNLTLSKINNLFQINTSLLSSRYSVYIHFCNLSLTLIRDLVLVVSNINNLSKKSLYQLVEFEFYDLDSNKHPDVFAHCDNIQLLTYSNFYFHKSGNNSVDGYNHFHNNNNNNKIWNDPRPNAKYRNGTFKGLDITFGDKNKQFGGILIRSIRLLKVLNAAFTSNKNNVTYSPSDIIEGPCKCVDNILNKTATKSIDKLIKNKNFDLNVFDNKILYFDLANKYNIKQLSPKRGLKTTDNNDDDDDDIKCNLNYGAYFSSSPRVGLTLKKSSSISLTGNKLIQFQNIKKEFVMAPYRMIRKDCLSKLKKYKALIALSMVYNKYYYNKLHNNSNNNNNNNNNNKSIDYEIQFGPFNKKKLQQLIIECKKGQNTSVQTIKECEKTFPKNNSGLAKLFGALM